MSRPSFRLLGHGAPAVPSQYTAWSAAVVAVGQSKFGEAWDGAEFALNDYLPIDREAEITARLKVEHADIVQKAETLSNARRLMGAKTPAQGQSSLLSDLSNARQSISDAMPSYLVLATQNSARKAKLAAAQDALFDDLLNSRIASFWYKHGSPSLPVPLPTGRLVAAQDKSRLNLFASGRIRLNNETWHVYVDTTELGTTYPPISDRREVGAALGLPHLSPYMELMIAIARKHDIRPDNQPFADVLRAEIKAMAPAFGLTVGDNEALSTRNVQVMATFLRQPLHKKGAPS